MTETLRPARDLTRSECLAFLRSAEFGRLVFTQGALPAVLPVAFLLDGERIVLRTSAGGTVASSVDRMVVALQADHIDVARRSGWTVTVIGAARLVTDEPERSRLAELPLVPWVAGGRDTYVVLPADLVSGVRIGGPER
jgi:uncharacterized protein